MTDVFDRAQALEAHAWELNQRRPPRPDSARWDELSAHECKGCGGCIPDARRRAVPGVQLCVDCQDAAEHKYQLTGGFR